MYSPIRRPQPQERLTVILAQTDKIYTGIITHREEIHIEDSKKIHILQCIPKLDKMDYIIQKCCELRVSEIVPILSRYTDIKGAVGEHKLSRWQKIAKEASIQSGRLDIMTIQTPIALRPWLDANAEELMLPSSYALILNEHEKKQTIHEIQFELVASHIEDIYVLIGAEGGFDGTEITLAKNHHFHSVTLGNTILRTETAPVAISAILQYLFGVL